MPGRTGTGEVNLDGGIIYASELRLTSENASMDITTGLLILDGNDITKVQDFIDDGLLTAYNGQGKVNMDYNVTNEGKTTLSATPLLDPAPADGATVAPGQVELSWTMLDPLLPGDPVTVDVYFTDDLQLDLVLTRFGPPDSPLHAPNEYFTKSGLIRGIKSVARIFEYFARE